LIIAIVVLGIIAALVWLQRQRRARLMEMERLRQRIAQDLHDEIGSSLGSIALIAQDILADDGKDTPARISTEIKTIADETVDAMRDITRLMQSERYGTDDLPTLLRETADRMLRGVNHTSASTIDAQTRRSGRGSAARSHADVQRGAAQHHAPCRCLPRSASHSRKDRRRLSF
jgi:signal transduction histidine kinase